MEGLWPRWAPAFESHLCPKLPCDCSADFLLADPKAWSLALGSCGIGVVGWADFSLLGGDLEGLILSLE